MSDIELNILMAELLKGQAYRCDSPVNEIRINTEEKATDDGSDGWSAKPRTPDDWLGSVDTCWQFKAGSAGEPARLKGEVIKRIPSQTLLDGGRFVVVASGSKNGVKGEKDRRAVVASEAEAANIPPKQIDVIGSERLANWCNQHPAIAAYWAGNPAGLGNLDDWSSSAEHQVPWQSSADVEREFIARRSELDFATGEIWHIHIYGFPGVGKTRLALELCRGAPWRSAVIYIRQAADCRLQELIDSAAQDRGVRLVVVADEVQADQLRPLCESVGRGDGRIRLITVGHSPTPDPTRIPALLVKPLRQELMREVIRGWYPAMPQEHVDFVVRFADGYVRLARLSADAVARSPAMDVKGLLGRYEIRGFLDGMLGGGDRRPLYVVAVLTSVGWADDKQIEGEAIAKHLGLEWNSVRATVEDFDRRLGIAPRSGRYRYISPTPLGIHLAIEAWTIYPDLLRSLPDVLPSAQARDAYYERLRSTASNPQARDYARQELGFFFRASDFFDGRAVRRWAALSNADPDAAARSILKALSAAGVEDRRRIVDQARRESVWTLVHLAWRPSSFHDAVKALALLAEAENEKWANNASAEFVARYQLFLSGTAVPYLKRLQVLDDLLAIGRPSLANLVVKALSQVGSPHAERTGDSPSFDELLEQEWNPSTGQEQFECVEAAIVKLSEIATFGIAEIQDDLVAAATDLAMLLRAPRVRPLVASYFAAVRAKYPETREPLRRIIAQIIQSEKKYWKELTVVELEEIDRLHSQFEDSSFDARLRQFVGPSSMESEEKPELRPLAEELLSNPQLLKDNWPWLSSGDAADAWRLGENLAAVDVAGSLAKTLPPHSGSGIDLRLVCGYISARRRSLGDEWYNSWVVSQFERNPKPIPLLFEVAWRCGITGAVANILATLLRSEQVSPKIVGQLAYGHLDEILDNKALEGILRAMTSGGHSDTAIGILAHRMESNSAEIEFWKPLARELALSPELIRSGHMANYYWKKVATLIVAECPGVIAGAIFREQAERDSGTWFAKHSEAEGVLFACAEHDPTAVWQAMQPYLSAAGGAFIFSVGFPRGVLERLASIDVISWIAESPEDRARAVARLTNMDMSGDDTLASRIIGAYGDLDGVASEFFADYVSGTWHGRASTHWDELADSLGMVEERTKLPKLRHWAADSMRALRSMADRDRQREAEEDVRGR